MLTCKKCKQEKDESLFYTSTRTRNGYRGNCKACCNAQVKIKRDAATKVKKEKGKPLPLPSIEYLHDIYEYIEGTLYRKVAVGRSKVGDLVGYDHISGYKRVSINHNHYLVHRLIWKMFNNEEPPMVDHINGNKHDNRIENLRAATRSENCSNKIGHANSETGFCGVTLNKWKNKTPSYVAKVRVNNETVFNKRFGGNLRAAVLAYNREAKNHHGDFADRKIKHNTDKLKEMGLI